MVASFFALSLLLATAFGKDAISSTSTARRISVVEIIPRTQQSQQSFTNHIHADKPGFYTKSAAEYASSTSPNPSNIAPSTLQSIATQCSSPELHERVEDHVFMALFDGITTGCSHIQSIWHQIPTALNDAHYNNLLTNLSHTISHRIFRQSEFYGIPEAVIKNISLWLEPELADIHEDLPFDIAYHVYRWLLARKYSDFAYFDTRCDFQHSDPFSTFGDIEATLSEIPDCLDANIPAAGIPKLNCSTVNHWHKTFVLALEFNVQISIILGINGGIGVGAQLKTIALAEFYWKAGGGLSLFVGFELGIEIPYVAQIEYLNGGTIKVGAGLQLVMAVGGFAMFNEQFDYIGYGLDVGMGVAAPPIVIDVEYIERKSIKEKYVNLTKICQSKTVRPSLHPTFRPDQHPTLRPNQHPTHKPIAVPSRQPSHPTRSPNHPTLRPPQKK
eukprot:CAMPEP_0197043486 /NCGR_PEP_ID=MMETSP1384-20130603/19722_1 /TAXON_ID=29189 /ORGANISM="Ammonia sp." /LENGTH=443 /DNA_ID=CAMNT_0042474793 /DNA_START=28 /DNA_END=1359 /DNA_ORIENTATION=-